MSDRDEFKRMLNDAGAEYTDCVRDDNSIVVEFVTFYFDSLGRLNHVEMDGGTC